MWLRSWVLLIRTDLGMSRGKIAVQAAHAAVAAALAAGLPVEIIRDAGRTQLASAGHAHVLRHRPR